MDDEEFDGELFVKSVLRRSLLYQWHLLSLGHNVEEKIRTLEMEVYGGAKDQELLWQRDIDELQLLLCVADPVIDPNAATKAVVYNLGYTKVIIKPDKNHARPHFHIHYKTEYHASYAIDNLERLAGHMPQRYEEKILAWASRKQVSLRLTWNELKAGKDIRELILDSTED